MVLNNILTIAVIFLLILSATTYWYILIYSNKLNKNVKVFTFTPDEKIRYFRTALKTIKKRKKTDKKAAFIFYAFYIFQLLLIGGIIGNILLIIYSKK